MSVTVGQVCAKVHNYFIDGSEDIYGDSFEISNGIITPSDFLLEGQYFRIERSHLNDGVFINTTDGRNALKDETFIGYIWAMRIPQDFLDLVERLSAWDDKYGAIGSANMSPYQSESYAGQYSYTKASGSGSDASGSVTWADKFSEELAQWKKVRDR